MSYDHEDDYSTRQRAWVEANEPDPTFDDLLEHVTRVTVVDEFGYKYTRSNVHVEYVFGNDGRTLKLILDGA